GRPPGRGRALPGYLLPGGRSVRAPGGQPLDPVPVGGRRAAHAGLRQESVSRCRVLAVSQGGPADSRTRDPHGRRPASRGFSEGTRTTRLISAVTGKCI